MSALNLMLVDDEERFLATTAKLLERAGHRVLTASSGQAAIERLGEHDVDVMILDMKMPGMGGLEVLREVRLRFPLVEVIMLTGHGTVESAVEGLKSGAFDFVTKPCDIETLVSKAEEAAARRRAVEDKIRRARTMTAMRSPRDLVRSVDGEVEN
jgi:DNA-binding NtrC family response regulator